MAVPNTGSNAGPTATCSRCGEPVDGHRFCEDCGHDLWLRRSGAAVAPAGPCPACGTNGHNGFGRDGVDAGADAALARLLHPQGPDMWEAVAEAADAVAAVEAGDVRTPPSCTLVAAVV